MEEMKMKTKVIVIMMGLLLWSMAPSTEAAVTDTVDFGNGAGQAADEAAHNLQLDAWPAGNVAADERWNGSGVGSLYWLMAADGGGGSYELTVNALNNRTNVGGGWQAGNWKLEYQHSAKNNLFNNGDSTVTEIFSGDGDPPLYVPSPTGGTMTIKMDLPFDTAGIGVRYRRFAPDYTFIYDASLARVAASPYTDVLDIGAGVYQSLSETAHSVTATMGSSDADSRWDSAGLVDFTMATGSTGQSRTIDLHALDADTQGGWGLSAFQIWDVSASAWVDLGNPIAVDLTKDIATYNFTSEGATTDFRYQRTSGLTKLMGAGVQVPEPATLIILSLGGLIGLRRKR